MRVLMLESHPGVAAAAAEELVAAGHSIARCATADRDFPCRGVAGDGECPLDEHVDVAVLAREPGVMHVEYGAVCAARSRVPVVDIGPGRPGPEPGRAPWLAIGSDSVTQACVRAARAGNRHAAAVAARLVALGVVAPAELEGPAPVVAFTVDRDASHLRLTIVLAEAARSREADIVRTSAQALRDFDRGAAVIDVVVRSAESVDQRLVDHLA